MGITIIHTGIKAVRSTEAVCVYVCILFKLKYIETHELCGFMCEENFLERREEDEKKMMLEIIQIKHLSSQYTTEQQSSEREGKASEMK